MCGIFGILTNQNNQNLYQIIINGLIQLQNRGYDSSGICLLDTINQSNNQLTNQSINQSTNQTINQSHFIITKYASTSSESSINKLLKNKPELNQTNNIQCGIGHNRWATHGGKTDNNAHPHLSNDNQFVLVHNGIIENYQDLKNFLIENNYIFYSQTDTEVIVNLISYYYNKSEEENKEINTEINKNKTFEAIKKTITQLQGTYGIIVINKDEPNNLFAVRNGSPLLIGYTEDYAIITSEQSGFCNMVSTYITLNNDDICIISRNNNSKDNNRITVDTSNQYIEKKVNILKYELTPDPFKHWTIKEIYEQPNTIFNSINRGGRILSNSEVKLGGLEQNIDKLKDINNIILLGCGTSYHAGLYGSYFLKNLCNFYTVQVFDGAELNEYDIPKYGNCAFILISQSGETKDLHRCIEIAKEHNIITIGIVNVVDSLIAREVDCGIYCNAGREMGVASTKAFTCQVVCLSMLSIWFAQINGLNENKRIKIIKDLHNLSNDYKNTIYTCNETIKELANKFINYNNLFLLGKGTDEYVAKEGSLKIKEISYIHSEGYSSSSLKHGPFALLDETFPTIIINSCEEHTNKIINCFEEVHSRNSPILFITNNYNIQLKKNCDIINICKNNSFSSLIAMIPLQLLAYYLSTYKNINPDIPKNLAKVVTVE
jgi:glucosamine--fructose-6-phosphate aminotransferase (isomerizing)